MKVTIEVTPEELRQLEGGGSITRPLNEVELQQGLLTETRHVRLLDNPSVKAFIRPGETAKEFAERFHETGPWLTVWVAGPEREESRGNHGDAGGGTAAGGP